MRGIGNPNITFTYYVLLLHIITYYLSLNTHVNNGSISFIYRNTVNDRLSAATRISAAVK